MLMWSRAARMASNIAPYVSGPSIEQPDPIAGQQWAVGHRLLERQVAVEDVRLVGTPFELFQDRAAAGRGQRPPCAVQLGGRCRGLHVRHDLGQRAAGDERQQTEGHEQPSDSNRPSHVVMVTHFGRLLCTLKYRRDADRGPAADHRIRHWRGGGRLRRQQNPGKHAGGRTTQTVELRCRTVYDSAEKPNGYQVRYRMGDREGTVRMDHDPGRSIPVENGELVLTGFVDADGNAPGRPVGVAVDQAGAQRVA